MTINELDGAANETQAAPDGGTAKGELAHVSPRPAGGRVLRSGSRLNTVLVIGAVGWIAGVIVLAAFAHLLPLANPEDAVADARIAPFQNWSEPLGTDGYGRSVLSRLAYGARASLTVGLLAVAVGLVLGAAVGLAAGYRRGKLDLVVGILTDSMLAFPGLVLLIGVAAIMGPGIRTLVLGLGFIAFPVFIRMARANTLRYADREFVQAARLLGSSSMRIVVREILPNVVPPLIAYAVIVMATLISAEASLSFLGLGIRPPTASWGSMISDGQYELSSSPFLLAVPATTLAITVFAFNIVGDWSRRKLDIGQAKV